MKNMPEEMPKMESMKKKKMPMGKPEMNRGKNQTSKTGMDMTDCPGTRKGK